MFRWHQHFFGDVSIYFIRKRVENDAVVKYDVTVVPRDQPYTILKGLDLTNNCAVSKLIHKYFWSYIISNFSNFYKDLTVNLTIHVEKWVITTLPLVMWPWHFVRICLDKFYAHTKSMKNIAFDNFKLFPENGVGGGIFAPPPNKIGLKKLNLVLPQFEKAWKSDSRF